MKMPSKLALLAWFAVGTAGALASLPAIPVAYAAPAAAELVKMLQTVDDRARNSGDYKSLVYIEQKEKDKSDLVYQAVVYRRDETDKLVIMFLKPQSEAGKGYLRVDKNLFMYDPSVGRWERRTERERIGGTDSQRADFDESRLAEEYTPTFVAEEALGKYKVNHIKLTAKEGIDVSYPVVELWLDQGTTNVLKRQDFALSGRLMRTTYYPEYMKQYSPSKKADVYTPKEIRIFDEVEKGNTTTIVMQSVDLNSLDDSIFTKAWLESKSR
ncbi:MAG: outer membrane lipoprotein-sorting protein [Pseudomonadota bacterium]|nr:outer membrane lipoprotein-sorting protein [Pseudomonadota bacterium]